MENKRVSSLHSQKPLSFAYAIRSFVGYLEGTQKSAHTIQNYKLDLAAFQDYLNDAAKGKARLEDLTTKHLESFHGHLRARGLKANTRRRILLTVRRFLKYLNIRKKITVDVGRRLVAPQKIERVPATVPPAELIQKIKVLSQDSVLDRRNRVLLWTLAETGCLVSEVAKLRFEDWGLSDQREPILRVGGKVSRSIKVSAGLFESARALQSQQTQESDRSRPWLFPGFNRFGPLGGAMTPRAVENIVKFYAPRLGFPELTPRMFRHSVVLDWFKLGLPRDEIQRRLGLRTQYAFRSYEPLLKVAEQTVEEKKA